MWPHYGVGDVLLVPGGHVGDGPDEKEVVCSCRRAPVDHLSEY